MTSYVYLKDPFRSHLEREHRKVRSGMRVDTLLRKELLLTKQGRVRPYLVTVNGQALMQREWNRKLAPTDIVVVSNLPKGGGGGSNPLQVVLQIALIAASFYVPGLMGLAAGSWQFGLASAVLMIGGSYLLNLAFPAPTPSVSDTSRESASPTYTIQAQGNSARLLEAIPVLYGRFRTFPDFAAQPYTELRGNEQYLYQLFCITQGELDIEQIRIEDTPIDSFGEIETQVVGPYQKVTLFPDNVVTSNAVQQLQMLGPNEPGYQTLGPYISGPAGSITNALAVDVIMPGGGFDWDDDGNMRPTSVQVMFERQQIDDGGTPVGPWVELTTQTITVSTETPQMISYKVDTPPGRYQVQCRRISNAPDNTRTRNAIQWAGLKAYLESDRTYGDCTLLAMVIRATNNVNQQTARKVNVIGTRKLPVWDPVNGWSANNVATTSPAWAAADILRNQTYGRRLPTSRLNMAQLYRLSQVWAARGDKFNGVFDTTTQLWDALTKVLRVGRTMPMYYAGVIDFLRNEPKTLPTAMFSPHNMVAGSFNTEYSFSDGYSTPDHVIVEYTDDVTWQPATVTCVLPGGTATIPFRVTLIGCSNRDQAWREGITMAAANRDQRRVINFATEMEGYLPRYGDLVRVTHDVPQWGYSGRVLDFNPTTGQIDVSEPLIFTSGEAHAIAFRRRNGSEDGPYTIIADTDPTNPRPEYRGWVLGSASARAAIYISEGAREEFTHYQFGPTERRGLRAIALTATPENTLSNKVNLTFTNYADSVHLAETGGVVPPPGPESNLPLPPNAPIVDSVNLVLTPYPGQQNIVGTPANGASYYEFAISTNGVTWNNVGIRSDPFMPVSLPEGTWWVRIRAVGRAAGPWATWTGYVDAATLPLPVIDLATATKGIMEIKLDWVIHAQDRAQTRSVQIYWSINNVLGNAALLENMPFPASTYTLTGLPPGQQLFFWFRTIDNAGRIGPWYNDGNAVVGMSEDDAAILLEYLDGKIEKTQLAQALREEIESGGGALVAVEKVESELAAMYTIKTQLTVGGRRVIAGIGVGVENNEGILESQVLVLADRFAVMGGNGSSTFAPFVIDGGIVYINSAFIKDGSITNLKIGAYIQSNDFVNNVAGWQINKNGVFQLNGSGATGRNRIDNTGMRLYDQYGTLRVELSL